MRQFRTRVGLALALITLTAGTGYAVVQMADQHHVFLPGVDRNGNPDWNRGGYGDGKIYKDTRSGSLYATASATVRNASSRNVRFTNISYYIYDPWAKRNYQATSDEIRVAAPDANGFADATSWATYCPN